MSDIFISYSREDQRVADALANCLATRGWSVFVDHSAIPAGMTFDDFIEQELDSAKRILVLWSTTSVKSHWVLTEAHEGLRKSILHPVVIEAGVNIPLAFRRLQANSMIGWDHGGDAQAFVQLAADVARQLGQPAPAIIVPKSPELPVTLTPAAIGTAVELEDLDGPAWVDIPGGTFTMGAPDEADAPVHKVTLLPYKISRYPVTNAQYRAFVVDAKGDPPSHWDGKQFPHDIEHHPVTKVSWSGATAFCTWLTGRIQHGRVELPTEAQWEFAARGVEGRLYPWGNTEPTARHANFAAHVGRTTAVGSYPEGATPNGVNDLAGNVWEWCRDWYGPYDIKPAKEPAGRSSGTSRVLRGGWFNSDARGLRAAYRYNHDPGYEFINFGFRVAWSLGGGQK